jgi:hypothetical protein
MSSGSPPKDDYRPPLLSPRDDDNMEEDTMFPDDLFSASLPSKHLDVLRSRAQNYFAKYLLYETTVQPQHLSSKLLKDITEIFDRKESATATKEACFGAVKETDCILKLLQRFFTYLNKKEPLMHATADNYVSAIKCHLVEVFPFAVVALTGGVNETGYTKLRTTMRKKYSEDAEKTKKPMKTSHAAIKPEVLDAFCKWLFQEGEFDLRHLETWDFHLIGRISEMKRIDADRPTFENRDNTQCCLALEFARYRWLISLKTSYIFRSRLFYQ